MAQTANLGLPLIDANMTADVPRDMNALANAVDSAVTEAVAGVTVPDASTTQKGVVQLNDTTTSTSKTQAATANAVKVAYDRGSAGVSAAATAQAKADAAETPAGSQAKANAAETNAKNASLPRTGGEISGPIKSTSVLPLISKISGKKSWAHHVSDVTSNYYIVPSTTVGGEEWDFGKGIMITESDITWPGGSLNDLKSSVANGKQAIATAISGKGIPASGSDEFALLASKISQISTGMKYTTGALGNSSYGTIANLPFKPKALFISVFAQKPSVDVSGLAGVILQEPTVVFNSTVSASSSSESINVGLTSLNFGSNSVSFSLTDSGAQARSYIVFGE
jgi:phage-related tail fiber protein